MLINAAAGFTVPFIAGTISDRRSPGRFGRRGDVMLVGALIAAGGLVAAAAAIAIARPAPRPWALALAAIVALSRVYLGMNYPGTHAVRAA
jgi:hypothetical protein